MRKCILKFNEPTVNGHIYTRAETTLTRDYGLIQEGFKSYIETAYGWYTNATIEEDGIYCDVKLTGLFESFDVDHFIFTSAGTGVLSEGKYVNNFTLTHVNMTHALEQKI